MNPAKAIYHKFIPESVRNPIGMARRRTADRLARLTHGAPLPPPGILLDLQTSPFVDEFIRVGERSARSIAETLQPALPPGARVLDFGCGCGRTLLPLSMVTAWTLHGCDVHAPAVEWLGRTLGADRVRVDGARPPLPFVDASFDAVYAVSAFSSFSEEEQHAWSAELARVLAPKGLAAIATMGAGVIENFPAHADPANRATLLDTGFLYVEQRSSFDARAAYHTLGGLARIFSTEFELWQYLERGLDGFHDLTIFVKR